MITLSPVTFAAIVLVAVVWGAALGAIVHPVRGVLHRLAARTTAWAIATLRPPQAARPSATPPAPRVDRAPATPHPLHVTTQTERLQSLLDAIHHGPTARETETRASHPPLRRRHSDAPRLYLVRDAPHATSS